MTVASPLKVAGTAADQAFLKAPALLRSLLFPLTFSVQGETKEEI